jgi:hypothetical protein
MLVCNHIKKFDWRITNKLSTWKGMTPEHDIDSFLNGPTRRIFALQMNVT